MTSISRLAPCLLGGLKWPEEAKESAARHILHGLLRFSLSWELLVGMSPASSGRGFFRDKGNSPIYHDIRMFSAKTLILELSLLIPEQQYLKFQREGGKLPNLQDDDYLSCEKRRLSVTFMSGHEIGDQGLVRTVRVLLMTNLYRDKARMNMFMDWGKRGFMARGPNAGYMLLQSVLHGMLVIWGAEWSGCLDEVDKCVSVKVSDH